MELKIKSQIKKIADEFDLEYNREWFKYMWISVRHEILTEYIGYCPDPIYQKYGKTPIERINNINKFISSGDFQTCLKRYGGQIASRVGLKRESTWIRKIKTKQLRIELLKLNNKIKKRLNKADYIALLTKSRNKKEKEWQMRFCLRHEWIHILLEKNNIKFQKINKKFWPYDEGLDEYMGTFLDGNLRMLEKFRDKERYPMEKKNWVYAIKFRGLLQDKKNPALRKNAILSLIRKLKKKS